MKVSLLIEMLKVETQCTVTSLDSPSDPPEGAFLRVLILQVYFWFLGTFKPHAFQRATWSIISLACITKLFDFVVCFLFFGFLQLCFVNCFSLLHPGFWFFCLLDPASAASGVSLHTNGVDANNFYATLPHFQRNYTIQFICRLHW